MTGLADVQPDLATKRLAIFNEALPHATRFGVLSSATAPSHLPVLQAVEPASQKLGVQLHVLCPTLLPKLAAELVALRVDVIVALFTPCALAAQQATGDIPIVVVAGDPLIPPHLTSDLWNPGIGA